MVHELPGEVVDVGLHVEVTVPAEVEEDRLRDVLLAAADGLVYRRFDCVVRLRRRKDPLETRELDAGGEDLGLRMRAPRSARAPWRWLTSGAMPW